MQGSSEVLLLHVSLLHCLMEWLEGLHLSCLQHSEPAIAQLVEHLTVDICSDQMVPGSIPGGRIALLRREEAHQARLLWPSFAHKEEAETLMLAY